MSIENLKHKWHKSFNKAVNSIESYLTPEFDDKDSKEFSILAKWLIDNPHDPYDYMTNGYHNYRSNPFETNATLSTLHHALVDDGDISFVTMKIEGEVHRVFMIFACRHEDYFDTLCRKENEATIRSFTNGRESMHSFMTKMKEKHPEKTFNIKPLLSEKDFTFEAHRDPIAFINEVESYEIERKKQNEKTDETMKKFRARKP